MRGKMKFAVCSLPLTIFCEEKPLKNRVFCQAASFEEFFREKSNLSRMNFTRFSAGLLPVRNSGKLFLSAMETTISEGHRSYLIVRNHEPKDAQTSSGAVVAMATMMP